MNLWQGCECDDDIEDEDPELVRPDFRKHQEILKDLPNRPQPEPTEEGPMPDPKCDMNQISRVPYNVFSDGVYKNFCEQVGKDKGKEFKQTVDSKGAEIKKKRDLFGLFKRTPPPNPDAYKDYNFELSWTGGDGSCSSDCHKAFDAMALSPCGHTAGQQNIMSDETSLDTGCGIYKYKINGPPKPEPEPEPEPPKSRKECNDGSKGKPFNRDKAMEMVNEICKALHDDGVKLSKDGDHLPSSKYDDIFSHKGGGYVDDGNWISMNPNFALDGCDDINNPQVVDFGAMSVEDCVAPFQEVIDGCPNFENPNGDKYWKWGGKNKAHCAFWTVSAFEGF